MGRGGGKRLRRLGANPEAVAFSPDGLTLASGGHDCAIRLWDVATGQERTPPLAGHGSPVRSVAVSAGGTVATCGGDRFVRLWDAASGRELRRLKAATPFLAHMALSPDGKVVASTYCLWDSATGKELGRFKGQDYSIEAMAFSPDGRTLATAARDTASAKDRMIRLWDVTTGRELRRIGGHKREVSSVAFSPDGKAVASSSFDGDLFLWEPATGKQVRPLVRGGDGRRRENVLAVAFAPGGKMLASAEHPFSSREGASITLWEVATGRVRLRLAGHQGDVNALAFAPDGRALVSGSTDTTALVWDVMGPPRAAPSGGPEAWWDDLLAEDAARGYRAICALATSPRGARLLGRRLSPVPAPDARRVARLIKDLDSDVFGERSGATQGLEELGEAAEPALRKALSGRRSVEARLRLERIVGKRSGEWLRARRAVEALELAGTPAAKQVLQPLARGAADARLTREAKAALERWTAGR